MSEQNADYVRVPKDAAARAKLARFAGLTDEERVAVDEWCRLQAVEDDAKRRHGLEAHGDDVLGEPAQIDGSGTA